MCLETSDSEFDQQRGRRPHIQTAALASWAAMVYQLPSDVLILQNGACKQRDALLKMAACMTMTKKTVLTHLMRQANETTLAIFETNNEQSSNLAGIGASQRARVTDAAGSTRLAATAMAARKLLLPVPYEDGRPVVPDTSGLI